jgi:hypothetical protein
MGYFPLPPLRENHYIAWMQFIATPAQLQKEFLRLMDDYDQYHWSAAWAGIGNAAFKKLQANQGKIRHIVIGIHFYQTHPEFIEAFRHDHRVLYKMQPDGTFHPKVYLFESGPDDWALLIGSANFTKAALSANSEATILITSLDPKSENAYQDARTFILQTWKTATDFENDQLFTDYQRRWKLNRSRLRTIVGKFGTSTKTNVWPHSTEMMNWTWAEYVKRIYNREVFNVEDRLRVLDTAEAYFRDHEYFSEIPAEARKFIAGARNKLKLNLDQGYFGAMGPNGLFVNRAAGTGLYISEALDHIPLTGEITRDQYDSFTGIYQQAFTGTRLDGANNLGTATRLLCMKRPDVFVCYDGANKKGVCEAFHLKEKAMNFDNYWADIICRIRDSLWYINPTPRDTTEERISNARAAFIDSLYYVPKKKKK